MLNSCLCPPEEQTLSPQNSGVDDAPPLDTTTSSSITKPSFFEMKSLLLVVTGSSKGLGKAIVNYFCLTAPESMLRVDTLHVILVARSSDLMEDIGRRILQHHEHTDVNVKLTCHTMDLSDLETLEHKFDQMFQEVDLAMFERVVFVNNAGSIGFLGPCAEYPSLAEMKSSVDFNITSSLFLSSRFAGMVQQYFSDTTNNNNRKVTLVNISSLLAVQSFPTMGIYGAGKAARDHYHATMAKEIPAEIMKILNYAPGPLETDMVTEIRGAPKLDEGLRPAFDQRLIEPHDSARKLVELVLADSFESGTHVDYYDLPDDVEGEEIEENDNSKKDHERS